MTSKLLKIATGKKGTAPNGGKRASGTGMQGAVGKISANDILRLVEEEKAFRSQFEKAAAELDLAGALRAICCLSVPPSATRGFVEERLREVLAAAELRFMQACDDFSMLCCYAQDLLVYSLCSECAMTAPPRSALSRKVAAAAPVESEGGNQKEEGGRVWRSGVAEKRCECQGMLKDWCYSYHGLAMEHYAPGLVEWCKQQGDLLAQDLEEQGGQRGSRYGAFSRSSVQQMNSDSQWQEKPMPVLLPHGKEAKLMQVLKHFLSKSGDYLENSGLSLKMTTAFLAFVQYYSIDRLSLLVGFPPSKSLIDDAVTTKMEASGSCHMGFGALLLVKDTTGTLFGTTHRQSGTEEQQRSSDQRDESPSCRRKLALGGGEKNALLTKAGGKSERGLSRVRHSKTQALRERENAKEEPSTLGSLSLALPEEPIKMAAPAVEWRFVRSLGKVEGDVEVLVSADQTSTTMVSERFCYPLPEFIQEQIVGWTEEDPAKLQQLISNPINHLSRTLLQLVQDMTFDFFADHGIDIEAIRRAHRSQALLGDTFELQKAHDALVGITEGSTVPPVLLMGVQSEAIREIRAYFSSVGAFGVFKPTLVRDLAQLQELYSRRSVLVACCRLKNNVNSSLEQLKFKKFQLLKGNLKKELVAWWLKLISSSVKAFIAEWGFISAAVSKNYTEVPPSDLNHVRRNIDLIAALLQPAGKYKAQMDAHIKRLQDTIYPRIDAFVRDTKAVISAELKVDITDYTLEQVKDLAGTLSFEMDDQMATWVDNTIMDIVYLEEMRLLDDPEYSKGKSRLDIVPVTGLVVSVLLRLENEHKTVLELWSHLAKAEAEVEDAVESLALHKAVTDGNEKLAEHLLEAGLRQPHFNINEQDQNGWTALHCAASCSRFRMCRRLLAAGADPDVANQDHSTPMIYIVKRRVESVDPTLKKERCKTLKALFAAGASPLLANKLGEQPLHLACLRGHVDLARILLANSTVNINTPTKKQETPLHYAVRARSPELVTLLLEHGADMSMESIGGVTPLDRALESDDTKVVEALRAAYLRRKKL